MASFLVTLILDQVSYQNSDNLQSSQSLYITNENLKFPYPLGHDLLGRHFEMVKAMKHVNEVDRDFAPKNLSAKCRKI